LVIGSRFRPPRGGRSTDFAGRLRSFAMRKAQPLGNGFVRTTVSQLASHVPTRRIDLSTNRVGPPNGSLHPTRGGGRLGRRPVQRVLSAPRQAHKEQDPETHTHHCHALRRS
jgi:hypothetical protein